MPAASVTVEDLVVRCRARFVAAQRDGRPSLPAGSIPDWSSVQCRVSKTESSAGSRLWTTRSPCFVNATAVAWPTTVIGKPPAQPAGVTELRRELRSLHPA